MAELFEAAVRLHTRRLLAIARAIAGNRASAEDVVQQALTNLYQHRDRYDWADPVAAGAMLRRAVVNEALRLLRQPRMSEVTDDHPAGADARHEQGSRTGQGGRSDPAGGLSHMIDRETVARVRQAIDRLPENFRAALVLCEYENMAYAQIAEMLGASVPQVKTWLHRGRKQLAEMLGEFMAPARPRPTLAPAARPRVRPVSLDVPGEVSEPPAGLPAIEFS
jgi:RNA polymerase sigma-70 factor (ECF subfamily)